MTYANRPVRSFLDPPDLPKLPPDPYRIIITGSRRMRDPEPIIVEFGRWVWNWKANTDEPTPTVIIVHGDGPGSSGAPGCDQLANELWQVHIFQDIIVDTERHSPEKFGRWPECGPLRNAHMAQLGATECLAFPARGPRKLSPGTWNMMEQCVEHGIPVRITSVAV